MGAFYTVNVTIPIKPEFNDEYVDRNLEAFTETLREYCEDPEVTLDGLEVHVRAGGSMSHSSCAHLDESIQEFVDENASSWCVKSGEYEGEFYEEIIHPPGVSKVQAEIELRYQKIEQLHKEIMEISKKGDA